MAPEPQRRGMMTARPEWSCPTSSPADSVRRLELFHQSPDGCTGRFELQNPKKPLRRPLLARFGRAGYKAPVRTAKATAWARLRSLNRVSTPWMMFFTVRSE